MWSDWMKLGIAGGAKKQLVIKVVSVTYCMLKWWNLLRWFLSEDLMVYVLGWDFDKYALLGAVNNSSSDISLL